MSKSYGCIHRTSPRPLIYRGELIVPYLVTLLLFACWDTNVVVTILLFCAGRIEILISYTLHIWTLDTDSETASGPRLIAVSIAEIGRCKASRQHKLANQGMNVQPSRIRKVVAT